MKTWKTILIVVLVIALFLIAASFFVQKQGKENDSTNPKDNKPDSSDTKAGPMPCQQVPDNLPKFQNAQTPSSAKSFLKVSDDDWTPDFEARLRGFFLAVDVEPSDFIMKYFGANLIWQYLNSPDGQLPDLIVLKGSKRCDIIVGIPSQDIPKPPFCLSFSSGNWLEPTYQGGTNVGADAIRDALGIPKSEWTPAMQSRVKGFFKAIDIEPSAYNAKGLRQWYQRYPAKEYLNSALGGLPDTLITKGIMRCDGKSSQFINDL